MGRKMEEGSLAYNKEALELALSRVRIYPCINCGHPLVEGYCCNHCYSGDGHDESCEPSIITYVAYRNF